MVGLNGRPQRTDLVKRGVIVEDDQVENVSFTRIKMPIMNSKKQESNE